MTARHVAAPVCDGIIVQVSIEGIQGIAFKVYAGQVVEVIGRKQGCIVAINAVQFLVDHMFFVAS